MKELIRQVLVTCLATVVAVLTRWLYERLALPLPANLGRY
jgi:hypothetical protein